MKKKATFLPTLLIFLSVLLSACSGLLPLEDEPVSGEFGPAYSSKEHQTRTFDALWEKMEDAYIYYDTADVNWTQLHDQYLDKINEGLSNEEFIALIEGLETDLPAGSVLYQSRAERIETDLQDTSTFDGIGMFVGFEEEEAPHIVILAVIEGSPAEAAGLKAHDSIFSIDGNPVLLEEGLNVVQRIRGPSGSSVTLNVQSPGKPERQVEVERAKLTSTGKLESHIISGTDYGYILFPPVGYQSMDQDVFNALQTFTTNRKLNGLVLDLRISTASTGWPLDTLFTMFHNGKIGELYNRMESQPLQVEGQDVAGSQTLPLVILVGNNTSRFAELFAASLQMYERAVIVGEPTPGNVETQSAFYLPDGSRIYIESTSFRLSNGDQVGVTGITPDVPVEASWDQILPENDPVLDQAIEVLEKSK
jgi:carboxyl-terminal processing protease